MIKLLIGIGIVAALAVGFYVYRNVSAQPTTVVEQTEKAKTATEVPADSTPVKRGSFTQIDGYHKGTGQAVFYETADGPKLALENGFSVAAGPDLFVYISKKADIESKLNADIGEFASLGALRSTTGTQLYNLPADFKDYNSVVIWCRAFGVMFTNANLQ